jgi:hypothetical protein
VPCFQPIYSRKFIVIRVPLFQAFASLILFFVNLFTGNFGNKAMKIILDVKDDKASFMMEVLKNFKDVKATQLTGYKADVLEGIKEAVEEVKLIKQGKLKGIPAKDLI